MRKQSVFGALEPVKEEPKKGQWTEEDGASFFDMYRAAYSEDTAIGGIVSMAEQSMFGVDVDKDFRWNDERINKYMPEDLDHEGKMMVAGANSDEEAVRLLDLAYERQDKQRKLDSLGILPRIGYGLLAVGTDPSTLIGAGLLGTASRKAASIGIGKYKTAVTLGMAEGAVYTMPQYMSNEYVSETDVAINAIGGAIVGGLSAKAASMFSEMKSISIESLKMERLNNKEKIAPSLNEDSQSMGADKVERLHVQQDMSSQELGDEIRLVLDVDESMSLLQNQETGAIDYSKRKEVIDKLDFTRAGHFKRMEEDSDVAKFVTRKILSDSTGTSSVGGENMARTKVVREHDYLYSYGLYNEIAQSYINSGKNVAKKVGNYLNVTTEEFDKMVFEHQSKVYKAHVDKEEKSPEFLAYMEQTDNKVIQAGELLDRAYAKILSDKKKYGVKGFEKIKHVKGYMPRLVDTRRVALNQRYAGEYVKLIAEQLKKISERNKHLKLNNLNESPEENATKIKELLENVKTEEDYLAAARRYYGYMTSSITGAPKGLKEVFGSMSKQDLVDIFGDEDIVKSAMEKIKEAEDMVTVSDRTKRRLNFDTSASITASDGVVVRLDDLYSMDTPSIFSAYAKEASGEVAMAEQGIGSKADWDRLNELMAEEMLLSGKYTTEQIRKSKDLFNDIYSLTVSRPVHNAGTPTASVSARRAKEFVGLSVLEKAGLSQLVDISTIMANLKIANVLTNSKAFNVLRYHFGGKKRLKINKEIMADIDALTKGFAGSDHLLNPPIQQRLGEATGEAQSRIGESMDRLLGKGTHHLYTINGVNYITKAQQRLVVPSAVRYLVDSIVNGKETNRLVGYGVTRQMAYVIKEEVKSGNITFTKNGAIETFRVNRFKDREMAVEITGVIRNMVDSSVLKKQIGDDFAFMASPINSVMLAIMNFAFMAQHKILYRAVNHLDRATMSLAFVGSAMSIGLGIIIDQLRNANKDDYSIDDSIDRLPNIVASIHPLSGVIPDAIDLSSNLPLLNQLIPQEYTPRGSYFGEEGVKGVYQSSVIEMSATAGVFRNVSNLMALPVKAVNDDVDDGEAWNKIRKAVPFADSAPAMMVERFVKEVGDE